VSKLRLRLGAAVCDQAISSVTNAAVLLLSPKLLTTVGYGSLALAMVAYALILSVARAFGPLLVAIGRGTDLVERDGPETMASRLLLTALLPAFVATALLLISSIFLSADLRSAMLGLALVTPVLVGVDAQRYAAFACGKPMNALKIDAAWLGFLLPSIVAMVVLRIHSTPLVVLLIWGGTALPGAFLFGLRPKGGSPRCDRGRTRPRAGGGCPSG
jgi:hypothetical protein